MAKGFINKKRFWFLRMILKIKKDDLNPKNITINKDDSLITWYVYGTASKIYRINKALSLYDAAIKQIFEHKLMNKLLKKRYSKEDQKEVEFMLTNMTSIKMILEDG